MRALSRFFYNFHRAALRPAKRKSSSSFNRLPAWRTDRETRHFFNLFNPNGIGIKYFYHFFEGGMHFASTVFLVGRLKRETAFELRHENFAGTCYVSLTIGRAQREFSSYRLNPSYTFICFFLASSVVLSKTREDTNERPESLSSRVKVEFLMIPRAPALLSRPRGQSFLRTVVSTSDDYSGIKIQSPGSLLCRH